MAPVTTGPGACVFSRFSYGFPYKFSFFLAVLHGLQDLSPPTRDWFWLWQWKHQVLTTGRSRNSPTQIFFGVRADLAPGCGFLMDFLENHFYCEWFVDIRQSYTNTQRGGMGCLGHENSLKVCSLSSSPACRLCDLEDATYLLSLVALGYKWNGQYLLGLV